MAPPDLNSHGRLLYPIKVFLLYQFMFPRRFRPRRCLTILPRGHRTLGTLSLTGSLRPQGFEDVSSYKYTTVVLSHGRYRMLLFSSLVRAGNMPAYDQAASGRQDEVSEETQV
jgi:hypothetical protein